MKSVARAILLAAIVVSFASCGGESQPGSNHGESHAAGAALPSNLKLAIEPKDPKGVTETRDSVKDGERVVIQGLVGGRVEPIAANRAILTLLDSKIPTCDKSPMDTCPTPWDACCEPPDVISKNSLTIQVVDKDGHPMEGSLASINGVKPKAKIAVTGIAKVTADGAVLINADGIFVAK